MNYRTFLINLDRSVERLQACSTLLDNFGVEFERISAVYGADLSEAERASVYKGAGKRSYYKALVPGELGCYLSHRKAWQRIVDEELDFAVIIEDDIDLESLDYPVLVEAIQSISRPWYYIKLAGRFKAKNIVHEQALEQFRLVSFRKVPSRTSAQVVSLEGAKRLLAGSAPFGRPVDVDIQHWWEMDIHVDGLLPFPFGENGNAQSEIHTSSASRRAVKSRRFKQYIDRAYYTLSYIRYGKTLKHKLEQ